MSQWQKHKAGSGTISFRILKNGDINIVTHGHCTLDLPGFVELKDEISEAVDQHHGIERTPSGFIKSPREKVLQVLSETCYKPCQPAPHAKTEDCFD